MNSAEYVLGVDGGNTKTIALVARLDGTILGAGRGGCSDIYTDPDPAVPLSQVEQAVQSALDTAGIGAGELVVGAFSMAGADWAEDFALLETAMQTRGFGKQIIVVNDAVGALFGGSLDGPAVVVACGTGAATAARSVDGQVWHSSWWQDPQGAHELGLKTIRAAYRAELGIDPPTTLTTAVLRHFETDRIEDVLHQFTARQVKRPQPAKISRLSRALLDAAHEGDVTAQRIVSDHGAALGDYALAAARQVGIEGLPFSLVLAGGVFRHPCSLLADSLVSRVRTTSPGATLAFSRFEPAAGALLLALKAAGSVPDEALLARLAASLPESSLFAT